MDHSLSDTGLDGAQRLAQSLGDLTVAETAEVGELDRLAAGHVETGQRAADEALSLGGERGRLGTRALADVIGRRVEGLGGRIPAARAQRVAYSFDATIPPLLALLEQARDAYFARPHAERVRFVPGDGRLVHFNTSPDPRARVASLVRRLARRPERSLAGRIAGAVGEVSSEARNVLSPWRARRLAARLAPVLEKRA